MELINTVLVTQARSGSTRLPEKVLLKINGQELLQIHLKRLAQCKQIGKIVVATTEERADDRIYDLCGAWGFYSFRGSVDDVLDRFYHAVKDLKPEWVVRVTSDCPLIDPKLVDAVISFAKVNDADYAANVLEERFPDGQDVEVFKFSALERAWNEAKLKSEREHVTPYIRNNSSYKGGEIFSSINFPSLHDFSSIRMTVDEARDFELVKKLIEDLGTDQPWLTYTNYIIEKDLHKINAKIIRNEGMIKSLKND